MTKGRGCYEEDKPLNTKELIWTGIGIVLAGALTVTLQTLSREAHEREERERREYDAV